MEIYKVQNIKKSLFSRKKMNNDAFWQNSTALTSFILPWNNEAPPTTIFRALADTKRFYFRFDVIDTNIIVSKDKSGKMAVLDSDRVEIFFRSDEKMALYYGFEMDPAGRVLDYKAGFYRKFDYSWSLDSVTVRSEYTINGYRVWGCFPLDVLRDLNLLKDNKLQVGLFRGKCIAEAGGAVSFKWISWVRPDSETPDFHLPSAFGELRLGV
jgi:hypothetical protein